MIDLATLLVFTGTCLLLAATPGPNMSLILANTLSGGLRSGLTTLAGTSAGLAILVAVAAAGMSSAMVFMAEWFDVVRWIGALYLISLGVRQLYGWWQRKDTDARPVAPPAASTFAHGLLVSLSNPKVLLFLGAFLPQFVDPGRAVVAQLVILAVVFCVTIVLVDLTYTLLVARARASFDLRRLSVLDGVAGGLLLVGGVVLAAARRP